MPNTTCSVPDCSKPVWARSWCGTHYRRWQRTGSIETTRFTTRPCLIPGCIKESATRGWCKTHYMRWSRTGDTNAAQPFRRVNTPVVDGKRQCSTCGSRKSLDEFAEYNTCRPCKTSRQKAWQAANPNYWLDWQRANPDKLSAVAHQRRAQKLGRDHEHINRSVVFERDDFICQLCSGPIDMALKFPHLGSPSLDHIVPLSRGGHHLYSNVQSAHFGCNSAKGDRIISPS